MSFDEDPRRATMAFISSTLRGASTNRMSASGLGVCGRPVEGAVEPFDRDGVGAGNDQGVGARAGIGRGPDLADHLGSRHQGLAVEMPAALGHSLVLDLDRVGTGALEHSYCALDVEGVAEAGIGIDHDRQVHAIADDRDGLGHLAHRNEPDIRATEACIGDAGTGEIDGLCTRLLGDQCR
jgi:hypothetical protein